MKKKKRPKNDYTSVLSKILVSKNGNQDIRTPKHIFQRFNREYNFQLDPCTSTSKPNNLGTPYSFHYDPKTKKGTNGLNQNWSQYKSVFVNPPWNKMEIWMEKSYFESLDSCTVAVLIPLKTETKWFHRYALKKSDIIHFIEGRVNFETFKSGFIIGIGVVVFNHFAVDRRDQLFNMEEYF